MEVSIAGSVGRIVWKKLFMRAYVCLFPLD